MKELKWEDMNSLSSKGGLCAQDKQRSIMTTHSDAKYKYVGKTLICPS